MEKWLIENGGLWGVIVLALAVAIIHLAREVKRLSDARTDDAKKTTELVLQLVRQVNTMTSQTSKNGSTTPIPESSKSS